MCSGKYLKSDINSISFVFSQAVGRKFYRRKFMLETSPMMHA